MNDRIADLRCPECGALATDMDHTGIYCGYGHLWSVDSPETYTPDLLAALGEAEARAKDITDQAWEHSQRIERIICGYVPVGQDVGDCVDQIGARLARLTKERDAAESRVAALEAANEGWTECASGHDPCLFRPADGCPACWALGEAYRARLDVERRTP